MTSQADRIRQYVATKIGDPARQAGKPGFEVRAGDVHRALGLTNALPNICSAIGGRQFLALAGVRIASRNGPRAGANVFFRFEFDTVSQPEAAPAQRETSASASSNVPARTASDTDFVDAIALVSCVKTKRAAAAPASDLYISRWFQGARRFVERRGMPWFILSALHGLTEPETVIAPYEVTLKAMSVGARRAWAAKVLSALHPKLDGKRRIVILAGQSYREFLEGALRAAGYRIDVPMEGLAHGEQLSWLGANA